MKPKRNKKYRPRALNIPMMRETRDELALCLRMSIETLIAAPSIDSYNAVSLQLITLGRVVGPLEFMQRATAAMREVAARHQRVGKMGVSTAEAATLRDTARSMDHVIALVSVNKFAAAEAKTRVWCAQNGIQ